MTEKDLQEVEIVCPGPTTQGTIIKINGKKIDCVTYAGVYLEMESPPRLVIEKYLSGIKISGKFDIDENISFPDQPGKQYKLVEVKE